MAKERSIYTCTECGGTSPKWLGKCPSCSAWNTLLESVAEAPTKNRYQSLAKSQPVATLSEIESYAGLAYHLKAGHLFRVQIPNVYDCGPSHAEECAHCMAGLP